MKWLALSLAILNFGLWFLPDRLALPAVSSKAAGALPRVASLKPLEKVPVESRSAYICLTVGWFKSPTAVNAVGRAFNLDYRVESKTESLPPLHWVLVPPQPESEAAAQAEVLRAGGDDVYVVARGEYQNAISLGVFETFKAAERLMIEKKSENLNVTLAKFTHNRIGYALAFEVESSRETEVLQAVEADFDGDFDFIERNTCKGVATSGKSPYYTALAERANVSWRSSVGRAADL